MSLYGDMKDVLERAMESLIAEEADGEVGQHRYPTRRKGPIEGTSLEGH
jgi:hypothetical protein